jgi:hypothetical protein
MDRCVNDLEKNSGLVVGMETDLENFPAGEDDELVFFPGSKDSGTDEDYKGMMPLGGRTPTRISFYVL